jgi:outer membrane biosynthesis protein TonB
VIVLQSSGNANVDKYYTNEMSSWKVRPARKDNRNVRSVVTATVTTLRNVRSVVTVAVTLYVK